MMARQRGQVAIMFALVLGLFLVYLIIVVGDLLVLYNAAGRYDNAALVGAQAGASQLDVVSLREGNLVLDRAAAAAACADAARNTAGDPGVAISCQVGAGGKTITATVSRRVPLVFRQFGPDIFVTKSHTGTPVAGEAAPG